MSNLLRISGFRVMVGEGLMIMRPMLNRVRPVEGALQGSAKPKAVQGVEVTGAERPARSWQAERLGRLERAQPGGELKEGRKFF